MTNFCTKLRRTVLTCDKILLQLVWKSFTYSTEGKNVENSVESLSKQKSEREITYLFSNNETLFVNFCKKDSAGGAEIGESMAVS